MGNVAHFIKAVVIEDPAGDRGAALVWSSSGARRWSSPPRSAPRGDRPPGEEDLGKRPEFAARSLP